MKVGNKLIGVDYEPYIIAELSANHGGSLQYAKESIKEAAKCGVDAIKLQTYSPDTMTIKSDLPDFKISDGLWTGRSLYDLYQEAQTPFAWHEELFDLARQSKISLFSTPFDETAVDLLEELGAPAYKIASFELTDIPLIEYVARKQKPIFLSTGMASLEEITEAVSVVRKHSDNDLLLFHCVSCYPSKVEDCCLTNIRILKEKFSVEVGLSDHTTNNMTSIMAVAIGAVAIEKHFKLNDKDCGPDASFSLTAEQLRELVSDSKKAWKAKGGNDFCRPDAEKANKIFRRSLYFVNSLKKGDLIKPTDIKRIRPGFGIEPRFYDEVVGRVVKSDVKFGDRVTWGLIK